VGYQDQDQDLAQVDTLIVPTKTYPSQEHENHLNERSLVSEASEASEASEVSDLDSISEISEVSGSLLRWHDTTH